MTLALSILCSECFVGCEQLGGGEGARSKISRAGQIG